MASGTFITFEGGDGAGKTTLIEGIDRALCSKGKKVMRTRAPGATPLGEKIRSLLLERAENPITTRAELFLFLADRAQHLETQILPALSRGYLVLCDRYNDSTIAYQGIGRGLGKEQVAAFCHFATQGLKPRLTFYLDLDPRIGLERVSNLSKDRIEGEALSFHEKIRAAFLELAREDLGRFCILDARQSKEELLEQALEKIQEIL